jgi:hypothetical protein
MNVSSDASRAKWEACCLTRLLGAQNCNRKATTGELEGACATPDLHSCAAFGASAASANGLATHHKYFTHFD